MQTAETAGVAGASCDTVSAEFHEFHASSGVLLHAGLHITKQASCAGPLTWAGQGTGFCTT